VLVIPEHFSQDQYVLQPIVKAMLAATGRPRARVEICQDPLLGSVEQAMNWERINEIIDSYRIVHLFLLIVDRDGKDGRRARLDEIERRAAERLPADRHFFAEHAWQEVEVWALAGCDDLPGEWRTIRSERDPKEVYFNSYVQRRGLQNEPGNGRRTLGREAGNRYARVRQLCPELGELEVRINEWINRRAP
jgi:hypothetical protein